MNTLFKYAEPLFYISFGGLLYYIIEILYRGHSHYSMFLCGGTVFYCVSLLNRKYREKLPLIIRMLLCTFIILSCELLFGILFNLYLKMNVWDYSNLKYNYKGQICLTFSIYWFFLTIPLLFLEERIRAFFQ